MGNGYYAVIMAGGAGTRFWPASSAAKPKPFLPIAGAQPMIQATARRLDGLVPADRVLVVAGAEHRDLVLEALPELPRENILLEPSGRDTLPCLALANAEIRRRDPGSLQIVLPADHVIAPTDLFQASLKSALEASLPEGALVALGVRPSFPATGFGYIEFEPGQDQAVDAALEITRFVEKPDRATAERFLSSGRHLWNSGIYVWSTPSFTSALQEHCPSLWRALEHASGESLEEVYSALEPLSVDVGVMEQTALGRVVALQCNWSDVGSWSALAEVIPADGEGNYPNGSGQLLTLDSRGNVVHLEEGTTTALVGVNDLIVVHHAGATLVCHRDRAQDVKEIVTMLKRSRSDRA